MVNFCVEGSVLIPRNVTKYHPRSLRRSLVQSVNPFATTSAMIPHPTHHQCTESGVICTKEQKSCGYNCYLPGERVCLQGSRSNEVLCPIGYEICGNKCYDPNDVTLVCAKEGKYPRLCKAGQKGCGYDCYSPESGAKCYGGHTLCNAGEENCGDECYDPLTETCFNNRKVCRNNREPCGEYNCYWPQNETCYENDDRNKGYGYGSIACPKGQNPCGYSCYDPNENLCLIQDRSKKAVICPLNSELCGRKCYSLDVEKKCIGNTLCGQNEDVFGRECYDPKESGGMVCQNDKVFCKEGQNACGYLCYDSNIDKCVQLKDGGGRRGQLTRRIIVTREDDIEEMEINEK